MDTAGLLGSVLTVILLATSGMALAESRVANARAARAVRKAARRRA